MADATTAKANGTDVFRQKYRQLTDAEAFRLERLKGQASMLYDTITESSPSRMQSLAITNLEQAVMWAVKDITS